jgi:hypothetical protein
MQEVTVEIVNGKIVITGVGTEFKLYVPPVVDPPPIDPPVDPPPPPVTATKGIWIGPDEIAALPMSGAGWTELLSVADASAGTPSLSDQNSGWSCRLYGKALAYARTKDQKYLTSVLAGIRAVAEGNLESGSRALALGRELLSVVLAADVAGLAEADPALDAKFRIKLAKLLTYKTSQAGSLIDCSLDRPNNWGAHSIASWIAGALYLGDTAGVDKAAKVLKGWLGDRSSYAGFTYNQPGWDAWQSDPKNPVGVLGVNAEINGHNLSGAQPEELRRGGSFQWPPPKNDAYMYSYESMQGRLAAACMLSRLPEYADVLDWCDKGILRAFQFLDRLGWGFEGDDRCQAFLVNKLYGTKFTATGASAFGKNYGFTAWTHA